MGRKLNTSQPVVINTELSPLDDSFYIEPIGQLEQWYYDNSGAYAPNRQTTPLTLTPKISAFDPEDNRTYTPSFNSTPRWFVNEYNETAGGYVETEITATSDGQNVNYYKYGNSLKVKKNVSYSRAVQIRCVAIYTDPRDSGLTQTVEDTVTLSTNRDASVIFPNLSITNPDTRGYNPLVDNSSTFTFNAKAMKGNTDVTSSVYFVWYAVVNNVEVLANTQDWYVSGQNTATLTVDAMYGEEINVVLRAKESSSAQNLFPNKTYASIMWQIPDIDTNVISEEGGAVRKTTQYMNFNTKVNVHKSILSDEARDAHLRFNWKLRKSNLSTTQDVGWGSRIRIDAADIRNVNGAQNQQASTSIYPIAYLLGPYEVVTHNGEEVTHNSARVFNRFIN